MKLLKTVREKICNYLLKEGKKETYSAIPGFIEPHAYLLSPPPHNSYLYKITNINNLIGSILNNYLHFNCVASYDDFPRADINDGAQPPNECSVNASSPFEHAPEYNMEKYFDDSRARTYACSFSTNNSKHLWENSGNHNNTSKICIIFDYIKLKTMLNAIMLLPTTRLHISNIPSTQIFSINYGMINYVDWKEARNECEFHRNPIEYAYIKDLDFQDESEFRITLSALGIGKFSLRNGEILDLTQRPSLHLYFNYLAAAANGAIIGIQYGHNGEIQSLNSLINNFRIFPT